MPKVPSKQDKIATQDFTKPFTCHGMEFSPPNGGNQHVSDCPFCGREQRFFLSAVSGQCDCKRCGFRGNIYSFFNELHKVASESGEGDFEALCENRKFLDPESLEAWGVCKSPLTDEWIVPGYNRDGKISQIYRYAFDAQSKKYRLLCTTGMEHQIYGMNLFDKSKPKLYVCEGVWDAIALWEILGHVKDKDGLLIPTSNPDVSIRKEVNVLGIPGAQVFKPAWATLFSKRDVVFFNHNDHPKYNERTKQWSDPASITGLKRVIQILQTEGISPKSVSYLQWGDDGYTKNHPSGYDVRDALSSGMSSLGGRIGRLQGLLDSVRAVPGEWAGNKKVAARTGSIDLEFTPCNSFSQVEEALGKAIVMVDGFKKSLASMLAVVVSTMSPDTQLWMRFIGPPSSGKTELAEAISANSKYVKQVSNMRGFMSGYKSDKEGAEDHSLVEFVKDCTMVTKDGDTLMQSPNLGQILGEGRDLYDGRTSSHYRHGLNRDYKGVRFTWILCGTESLRSLDDSELGERFIDCVVVDMIPVELERKIGRTVAERMFDNMSLQGSGSNNSIASPSMVEFRKCTAGYVSYLRENAPELFSRLNKEKSMSGLQQCQRLAMFVSFMRARPGKKQKENPQREMSSRLTSQFSRLATSLAVVLNKTYIDREVMKIVTDVAMDTARGRVYELMELIVKYEDHPLADVAMASILGEKPADFLDLLVFLRKIRALEPYDHETGKVKRRRWRMTQTVKTLYERLHPDA